MFCKKCGTENEEDAKFCKKCGIQLQEIVEENLKETSKITDKPWMQSFMNLMKGKHGKFVLAGIGVLIILLVVVNVIANAPKKIDLLENAELALSGVDKYGTAEVVNYTGLNSELDLKMQQLLEDSFMAMSQSNDAKSSRLDKEYQDIEKMVKSISCSWDENVINGSLSNGDQITYQCIYDEELGNKIGYKYIDLSKTFTVEGLPEAKVLDLFKDITLEWQYDDFWGKYKLVLVNQTNDPFLQELHYDMTYETAEDQKEYVDITCFTTKQELIENGYIPYLDGGAYEIERGFQEQRKVEAEPKRISLSASYEDASDEDKALLNEIAKVMDSHAEHLLAKINMKFEAGFFNSKTETITGYKLKEMDGTTAIYQINCESGNDYLLKLKTQLFRMEKGQLEDQFNEEKSSLTGRAFSNSLS